MALALDSDRLRFYVVWVPRFPDDGAATALAARVRLEDPRAVHFWDGEGALARAMGRTLRLPGPASNRGEPGSAWDVFVVYPPGQGWGAGADPPRPAFWMQQLMGADPREGAFFEGPVLRRRLEEILSGRATGP